MKEESKPYYEALLRFGYNEDQALKLIKEYEDNKEFATVVCKLVVLFENRFPICKEQDK